MKMRPKMWLLFVLLASVLILLISVCVYIQKKPHTMTVSITMGDRRAKVMKDITAQNDPVSSQTLPVALEKASRADEADYAEIIRLTDEWAKREGFYRIPPEWFPRIQHLHTNPRLDRPNGQYIYYEEYNPVNTNWPIQIIIYVFEEHPGQIPSQLIDVNISACSGFSRQPSERFKRVHDTLRETMVHHFGEQRVHASID